MRRGCSHQVDKVRENHQSRLSALRDYTCNQVVQIRDCANNQIIRIRDYGSSQLEGLRETLKLQQQHIIKLLDTVNLDNCRSIIESECLHTESMILNIDLFTDIEGESVISEEFSDKYDTASSSPQSLDPSVSNLLTEKSVQEFMQWHGVKDDDHIFTVENSDIEMGPFEACSPDALDVEASDFTFGNVYDIDNSDCFVKIPTFRECEFQEEPHNQKRSQCEVELQEFEDVHLKHNKDKRKDCSFKYDTPLPSVRLVPSSDSISQQLDSDEDSHSSFQTPNTSPIKRRRDFMACEPGKIILEKQTDNPDEFNQNLSLQQNQQRLESTREDGQ